MAHQYYKLKYLHAIKHSILHICIASLLFLLATTTLAAATTIPSDPKALPATKAVQAYLAALSNNTIPGVIAGQNIGHSDDIANTSGLSGYIPLIKKLENQTDEIPGILGVDYEHNHIATPAELHIVNTYLIDHWNKGGLVSINWSPQNPWWNDESDIVKNPGTWTNTRSNGGDMKTVDLRELVNPKSAMRAIWLRKLDRISSSLLELQNAGVIVLWRPMQEMNGNWFWWGINTEPKNAESYIAIWRDMYTYFTQQKGLHNLLWVYSPNQSPSIFEQSIIKPPLYRYPGDDAVDIVAGTAYHNKLELKDYELYLNTGKPIAVAEFGPRAGEAISRDGKLDTLLYKQNLLKNYSGVAYWMSWSSWSNGDGTQENQALIHHKNAKKLLSIPEVITRKRLSWKNYLQKE